MNPHITLTTGWISSIESGTFRAVQTVGQLGRFPEIAVTIGGHEVARLGCLQSSPPRAKLIEGTTTVRVSSSTNPRRVYDINCENEQQAIRIAEAINQTLLNGFNTMFHIVK